MAHDFDYLIVGSGFGGSVSALRLAEKGYTVGVMEMGRRWTPEGLPTSNWDIRRFLWAPLLGLRGFLSLRLFRHVMVLHGNAVGGGSIAYAQTLLVPPDSVWREGSWAGVDDWTNVMPRHYATARRMLGVTENRALGPADELLRTMAETTGVGASFYPTQVGVFFGREGDAVTDDLDAGHRGLRCRGAARLGRRRARRNCRICKIALRFCLVDLLIQAEVGDRADN